MKVEPFKFGCIVEKEQFCPRPALEAELRRYRLIRGVRRIRQAYPLSCR